MTVLSRVRSWLRGLLGGRRVDAQMEAEFEHHISLRAEALERAGVPASEALRRARLEFGSTESARERGRQSRGLRLADEVRSDVRYGVKSLARAPGFLLMAVVTLGLGIGANAAMFSALDAVLLRPLPFAEPDRLVSLTGVDLPFLWEDDAPEVSAPPIGEAQRLGAFAHVAAYAPGAVNLSGSGPARRIRVGAVTADFLAVLGVQPARGRGFAAEETEPGGPRVAMVSDAFWRTHLGGGDEPGSTIVLDGRRHEVVGVMPRGFAFPEESEVWIPLTVPLTSASFEPFRQYIPSRVIARLGAGATLAQARRWRRRRRKRRRSRRATRGRAARRRSWRPGS
jgi:hypothetical protein